MALSDLPAYDGERCRLFALGRNAIYAACLILGLKKDDEILTPAFDCDGSLQPFKALGLTPVFYRSDPRTFSADIADMTRLVSPKTRLIHVINHFGFPQPWDALIDFRSRTRIPILEDNAYSLFSAHNGKAFGTFGDVAVFSLRKNLPLVDGGLLRLNNRDLTDDLPIHRSRFFNSIEAGRLFAPLKKIAGRNLIRYARRILGIAGARKSPPPPLYSDGRKEAPLSQERDTITADFALDYLRPMSLFARYQISGYNAHDYQSIVQMKRRFYVFIVNRLMTVSGIEVLWPKLDDGIVPFCVNILLGPVRDNVLARLRLKYDVMAWPTLPGAVLARRAEFPEVELLGRRLLQIDLPSEQVVRRDFPGYAEELLSDLEKLVKR